MKGKIQPKKAKGITLIALVITIIVLLILAVVTIATLTGDNGILTQAGKAKEQTKEKDALEKIKLQVLSSYRENGEIDLEELNYNLENNIPELIYNGNKLSKDNEIKKLPVMLILDTSRIVIEGNKLFEEFKGALTENFILNMLLVKYEERPNYYVFDRHEIDFIIQERNEIIPIEVKSSENRNNASLTRFNENNDNKISVRFSTRNLDMSGKILNVPIFMAEYIDKLIQIIRT